MRVLRTISSISALIIGTALVVAPAIAADIPELAPDVVVAPPPPAAFGWQGPYLGVFGVALLVKDYCPPERRVDEGTEVICEDVPHIYGEVAEVASPFRTA